MTQENEAKEDRLLKIITIKLEEYGMPHFEDRFPAMDILQLVKDAGYIKSPSAGLFSLNEKEIEDLLFRNESMIEFPPSRRPANSAQIAWMKAKAMSSANLICSKFAIPAVTEMDEHLIMSIINCGNFVTEKLTTDEIRKIAQAILERLKGK